MEFYSYRFLIFLILSLISYYLVDKQYKWLVISVFSLYFIYAYSAIYVVYPLLFSFINYGGGLLLEKTESARKRKWFYFILIWLDIGGIIFFRYINFVIENINGLVHIFARQTSIPFVENIIVPLGISYFSFQGIGYLIRVYKKQEKAEHHLGFFLSFTLFFPKFISGPIERSNRFLKEIREDSQFSYDDIVIGLRRLLWGAFKKVVVANNLGTMVYNIYGNTEEYTGIPLILLFLLQTIHLYFDFSGYTDMALGVAKMFGFNLMENFKRPFFAQSVSDFWRRYHISLSSWCNDFIFMQIIFKRRKWKKWASMYGVLITFLVVGVWHGANWTFIVLGFLQALAINYEFLTKRKRLAIAKKIPQKVNVLVSRVLVYLFYSFSLLFFYSKSLDQVGYILGNMFKGINFQFSGYNLGPSRIDLVVAFLGILTVLLYEYNIEKGNDAYDWFVNRIPRWVRVLAFYLVILGIAYYGGNQQVFVYQQF
jgi:alginate O-acetyltransferase complex protein AlgI